MSQTDWMSQLPATIDDLISEQRDGVGRSYLQAHHNIEVNGVVYSVRRTHRAAYVIRTGGTGRGETYFIPRSPGGIPTFFDTMLEVRLAIQAEAYPEGNGDE